MIALDIAPDTSEEPCIFFVWPLEVVHTIDEDSPLYEMSMEDLANEKFETIVKIEGNIETTSMTFQARYVHKCISQNCYTFICSFCFI